MAWAGATKQGLVRARASSWGRGVLSSPCCLLDRASPRHQPPPEGNSKGNQGTTGIFLPNPLLWLPSPPHCHG